MVIDLKSTRNFARLVLVFVVKMTKKFEFNWQIPVPEPMLLGRVCDRWTEEKDNTDLELNCTFKVDDYGFFIYWKSDGRVRSFVYLSKNRLPMKASILFTRSTLRNTLGPCLK